MLFTHTSVHTFNLPSVVYAYNSYAAVMQVLTWLGRWADILHFQTSPCSRGTHQEY